MDLIYEGITTVLVLRNRKLSSGQNGPDLRRDYDGDSIETRDFCVRMDLIYEGITTPGRLFALGPFLSSERTWFTKGLRRGQEVSYVPSSLLSERTWFTKGLRPSLVSPSRILPTVRKDLIYEGITTKFPTFNNSSNNCQKGPDLRRDYDYKHLFFLLFLSCQKGPDLRRDYDSKNVFFSDRAAVRKDLIYEGITT